MNHLNIILGKHLLQMAQAVYTLSFVCMTLLSSCTYLTTEKKLLADEYTPDVKSKGMEALAYCKENQLNTDFCILIDMNIHSGKNRLLVYDFNEEAILNAALCSHGCGSSPWGSDQTKESPVFSNVENSHLSSLGKYKIGSRGYSNWGININYKLYGLESTNNKAFDRLIVLHSWDKIPEQEVFPNGAAEGWGCPAISNSTMEYIDSLLSQVSTPVLLWIYHNNNTKSPKH